MFAEMTLPEFDQEMATTRRLLERLPEEMWDWRPNEKSNTIGWNANHLAEIPEWIENILTEEFFDVNPVGGVPYVTPSLSTRAAILEAFERNVATGRAALAVVKDDKLGEIWSFNDGGNVLFAMPRGAVFRSFVMSHMIHHRAILSVYYRINGVPVPAIYGPSADEA